MNNAIQFEGDIHMADDWKKDGLDTPEGSGSKDVPNKPADGAKVDWKKQVFDETELDGDDTLANVRQVNDGPEPPTSGGE